MNKIQMPENNDLIINMVGDISLNGIFCDPQQNEILSENMLDMSNWLGPCDLRIGNLESPLWGDGRVNISKAPRVATTELAARCLLPLKIDIAILANNHVFDCLGAGFHNTVEFLTVNNIGYLGAGFSPEEAARPIVLEKKGRKIGILAYVGPETNPNIPNNYGLFLNMFDEKNALKEIEYLSDRVDFVLVFLHWGSIELIQVPHVRHRSFARRAIDSGASVVVGGHQHCLQGHESWKSGHIFYDLGNYLFAPVTIPGKETRAWPRYARRGGVAVCRIQEGGIQYADIKCVFQKDLLLHPDDSPKCKSRLLRLSRMLRSSDPVLKRKWKRDVFIKRFIIAPLIVIRQDGLKSLFRLRLRHISAALKMNRIKRMNS